MLVKDRQTDGRTDSTITVCLSSSALGIMTDNTITVCLLAPPRHNKNDNNVGLLRTVKKVWIQEEHSKQ